MARVRAAIENWPDEVLSGAGLDLCETLADCVDTIEAERAYHYNAPDQRSFLGAGWSVVSPQGVWSDGDRADLVFTVERDGDYIVKLDGSFFLPATAPAVTIGIALDGTPQFSQRFVHVEGSQSIRFGPARVDAGRAHVLSFTIDEPRSPLQAGVSGDARKLGILLHAVAVTRA